MPALLAVVPSQRDIERVEFIGFTGKRLIDRIRGVPYRANDGPKSLGKSSEEHDREDCEQSQDESTGDKMDEPSEVVAGAGRRARRAGREECGW
jgi:hypothetical protein